MNIPVLKNLHIFLAPGSVLLAAYCISFHFPVLSPYIRESAIYAPWFTFAAGLFLAFHFNRGKPFFIILMLILVYWSIANVPSQQLFSAICLLLPINITVFCFMREKGIFNGSGRMRISFIVLQTVIIAWVTKPGPSNLNAAGLAELPRNLISSELAIPVPAFTAAGIGLVLTSARAFIRQSPVESGIFGALASVALAFVWIDVPMTAATFIASGGLIVSLSILRDSYNMAFRDELTGLPSRRALNEDSTSFGRRYVMAMLDVDHFKRVNDSYGHDVGDQVLKMIAGRIRSVVPECRPYRYGGEEFTVVFRKKTANEVIPRLEELRKAVAAYRLWIRGEDRPDTDRGGKKLRSGGRGRTYVSVTLSIGVAERDEELRTAEDVLRAADHALYRAKNKGRNRLCR